jgi:hypothetical protein
MAVDRVKFQEIVASQLPRYVREDFPLLTDFLEQYYVSQEYQSGPVDIANNIDQYVKVDELFDVVDSTTLTEDLNYSGRTVNVQSTIGFTDTNGIIQIDNEIIFYESKTNTSFANCRRGFSGVTTYITTGAPDELTFSSTETDSHTSGTKVKNLNILFLKQFFKKLKKQVTPGFSDRNFYSGLNTKNFIYNADSFYNSKGTDQSFEILFRALYGEDVEIIKPSQYLLTPSNADYKVTKDYVVEKLQGDPLNLKNLTIQQRRTNARGSITNVQQIPYGDYNFYQISIDSGYQRDSDVTGSIFGEFKPNPLTKLLEDVGIGATIINVDSTVDFPEYGNIVVNDVNDEIIGIAYSGKTLNQFFNCSGVTAALKKKSDVKYDDYSFAYVGIDTSDQIRVRFTSTLKDFVQNDPTYYFKKDDTIQIKSLGYEAPGKKNNNFVLNVKSKYKIGETSVIDAGAFIYNFKFLTNHNLQEGYSVRYENEDNTISVLGSISRVISGTEINVRFGSQIPLQGQFFIENQLLKGSSTKHPYINNFVANVQNTYAKFNGDVMVSSNSLPKYNDLETNTYDKKITFSATLQSTQNLVLPTNPTSLPDHGFYTGDSVYFESNGSGFEGIPSSSYFVYRVNESTIRLSRSKADLSIGTYVTFNGSVTNASVSLLEYYRKNIEPQGIYRQILEPTNSRSDNETTKPGYTGIFNNGLELLNYKSSNSVYYGNIIDFTVTGGGEGYDVINPPIVNIQDEVGTGATGVANVIGQLVRLDVTDPGMGYYGPPTITIAGGNGVGAAAEPRMISVKLENPFIANFPTDVNLTTNNIIFENDHKFLDGESIIYEPRGTKVITGLTTDSEYFAFVTGQKSITLHKTRAESISGINTVNLTAYGDGVQYFVASNLKQVVSSVVVTNPGVGYENKKRTIPSVGVNTVSNRVEILNHGYKSKEIVRYTEGNPRVLALKEDTDYYVVKHNDNEFSLTEVGTGSVQKDFYYNRGVYIDFNNAGRGSFNYPPISVKVEGAAASFDKTFVEDFQELYIIESPIEENIITPVSVLAWTDTEAEITNNGVVLDEYYVQVSIDSNWLISDDPFIGNILLYEAKLQPVFRGSILSVDKTNGGVGYGASTIIDFQRQPEVTFESGRGAKLTPIINNGQITEVIVNNGGTGYNSPPDLNVISQNGTGDYAILVPILSNGSISSVYIQKGGVGYVSGKTNIDVIAAGSGARVQTNIRAWNVNLFEKNLSNIGDDDCVIQENISNESLQYASLYAPRELRRSLNSINGFGENNLKYGLFDLQLTVGGEETSSGFHSPIVGWAYDGNPIYGPYAFDNIDGTGSIRRMKSGYKLKNTPVNRPSYTAFANGFFVNDYQFVGDGDLDEHNGRFCVTPDYPNGVYAYFCTISDDIESSGPFNNYRLPIFPYVIGNKYKSLPIAFNFKSSSNQTEYDIVSNNWFRNTSFYFTNGGNASYDYIYNSDQIRNQSIDITATSKGSVDSLNIIDSGNNYNVNDKINFNSENTGGRNVSYRVSEVGGKSVNTVSLATTFFDDVEFSGIQNSNTFVGLTSAPHNFLPRDTVFIDGLSDYYRSFNGSYNIGVSSERWYVTVGLKTDTQTGIVTYVYVSGSLDENVIKPDDIIRIQSEKFKVLNIDEPSGRIRVLRGYDGTISVAHSAGLVVRDDPRKIIFRSSGITTGKNLPQNKKFYFAPNESLGLGTATSGITTIAFSNPGVGITQVRLEQQQVYIPNHGLSFNTPLTYYINGGTSIQVWSGVTDTPFFNLDETRNLFAVPLSKDIIGIASDRVAISTVTGDYVGVDTTKGGLLYFTNSTGLGSYHSLETNIPTVLKGRVSKNIVTVSTAQTHGLKRGDRVTVDVNPTTTTNIKVVYNDYNRRIVFDPDTIQPSGINTNSNTITVPENKYKTGDKIIYTSGDPSEGLVASDMYYVFNYKNNLIKLVDEAYQLFSENPDFINVGSATTGTIARINPQVTVQKNQNIKFDLSDSSLSFVDKGITYSAFEMLIYSNSQKTNEFWTTKEDRTFEVTRSGRIGIDSTAYLNLFISNTIPNNLYYGFEPDNLDIIPPVKRRIYEDGSVRNNNNINLTSNKFDGNYSVVGVTSRTFDYNIPFDYDTVTSYGSTNAVSKYQTTSLTAFGPITRVSSTNRGVGYQSLPGFTSITSNKGQGALLEPTSTSIGSVLQTKINYIGFGYPSDKTLNAVGNLPQVLKVDPLGSFKSIGITSGGVNYSQTPDLVVIDGFTGQVVPVELEFEKNDNYVTIVENTTALNNVPPQIIPTQNTNGFSISSVSYNTSNNIVRLTFSKQFSDAKDWPFKVGENVIVENVAVGFGTTGKGYNSEDYNYSLFEVTSLDSQLGGSGAYIEYDLTDYLAPGEVPGNVTNTVSGSVTPETFFPIFDPIIETANLFEGEEVINGEYTGTVERFDPVGGYLFITSEDDFTVGTIIESMSSGVQARILSNTDFNSTIRLGVGATFIEGWQNNSGFLNDNLQVIPNNEYYQNFSYSLKSRVALDTWDDAVSSLNHTAGFEKFADLVIDNNAAGIVTAKDVEISTVIDLIGEEALNCFPDFDGGTERTVDISGGKIISNEIVFENKILVDYFESRGNRVLSIDDFSGDFNSEPRTTPYSIVKFFDNKYAWNKFFVLIQDTEIRSRKQFGAVTIVQDGDTGYVNQYGTLDTGKPLGSFEYIGVGTSEWGLAWYPNLFEYNNYEISYFTFSGVESVTSIGNTDLGDVVRISTASTQVAIGDTTTLVSISNTYRAAKLHIQMEDASDNYFYNELNILNHNDGIEVLQYGNIDSTQGISTTGFGTYHAYIDGSNIKVDIIPTVGTAITANTSVVAISTNSSGVTTTSMIVTNLSSYFKSIASSASPTENIIASYEDPFACEYFMVSVEDTTNEEFDFFEVHALDSNNEGLTKYGQIITNSGLGTVGLTKSGTSINLVFTPLANIDVEVRAFGVSLKNFNDIAGITSITLDNNILFSDHGTYTGTEFDKRTAFNLKHRQKPIFQRAFLGNSSSIVDLTNNTVTVPDHYFVTGEKIVYSYENSDNSSANAIGIATTTISGVSTDKLPSTLYVVKVDSTRVGFATNAAASLTVPPTTIDLYSIGIGTFHKLTATNQNARALIAIDNMIQAPVTESVVSTTLDQDVVFDVDFEVTGITSFKANDIIKIDDEIMLIQNVGVGLTNNFKVLRAQLGTKVASHSNGTTVELLGGNYNIVDNTVHFVSAPFGGIPIGTTTDGPDETDWSGITTYSTFQGRTFMRSGIEDTDVDTYSSNYTFDNIQKDFNGQKKTFSLLQNGSNVIGFATNQAIVLNSNILQEPQGAQSTTGDFTLGEIAGVTSITYLGDSVSSEDDPNRATIPRGGTIISVASTPGLGFQPLISAGASCFVSAGGTITSISIGNSGSGYRTGVGTINVGYAVSSTGITTVVNIGTATVQNGHVVAITTNYFGANLDQNYPPVIVIDAPLPYSSIPLVYNEGTTGIGTGAKVDVKVGQGSSIIEFEIVSGGFGYGISEELRLSIGGTTGIQTEGSGSFDQFVLTVTDVYRDTFNGFTIGELDVFDKLDDQFDGVNRSFPLSIAGNLFAIETAEGSNINIAQCLIVTINDILQVPNQAYKFNGGSLIEFTEAPKKGDSSKIIFYKGTPDVDVVLVDILETVKIGDTLQLKNDSSLGQGFGFFQEERIVTGITTLDTVRTFPYDGPGITTNKSLVRPITWCKQIDDISINGSFVTKDRVDYEPSIYPAAYITSYVGVNSTQVYTDTTRPFFNSSNETSLLDYQDRITIVDQSAIVGAVATVTVSAAGTVTGFTLSNVGAGYSTVTVSIGQPIDIVGGTRATATASVSAGGTISGFTITNAGAGYSLSNPPEVLISVPKSRREVIGVNSYFGDQGIIVGYAQSSGALGTLELYIPQDSFMRDDDIVGTGITLSTLNADDLFVVNLSSFGLSTNTSDGIYRVSKAYDFVTDLNSVGLGTTAIRRVEVENVGFGTTVAGFTRGKDLGEYTWGKIQFKNRVATNALTFTPNGYSGLTTSPVVQRLRPLKFNNYLT